MISSKAYRERQHEQLATLADEYGVVQPLQSCEIKMTIFFPDRRRSDLTNKAESIIDLLVDYGFIKDDNHDVVYSLHLHSGWVDKDNPRAEVIFLW